MGSPLSYEKKGVWFVGGNGSQVNKASDNGAGCSQVWWDNECPNKTQAEFAAAYAKLMGTDGGPIVNVTGSAYTNSNNRITESGEFDDVEVGMVVYVIENPTPDVDVETGRYEITGVDPSGNWIECNEIEGSADANVDIKIGGAFDSLNNAVDNIYAGSYGQTINTNLNETLTNSVTLSSGGNQLKNIFKRIIGYNTIPGDMNRGEAYYESPYEILQNGSIDSSKCVTLDADGDSFNVLYISSGADNLVFENLHLTGTTANGLDFSGYATGTLFRNCRFSDMASVIGSDISHILFDCCYSHDDLTWTPYDFSGGANCVVLNCVSNLPSGINFVHWTLGGCGAAIGNLAVGGMFGFRVHTGGGSLIIGNTLYNTSTYGLILDGADSVVAVNNIFCLAPGAVGIYSRNGGSVVHNDYNCFIESDGTPLTVTGSEYSGGEAPVMGAHSVQADPDFVDAANGNFRVRNPLVLRGGRPGPDGSAAVIGAIGQEYQFAKRARVMNAGRAGIVR